MHGGLSYYWWRSRMGSRTITRVLELGPLAVMPIHIHNEESMPDLSDLVYILFLVICVWLAINYDGDGGGGRRSRVPAM